MMAARSEQAKAIDKILKADTLYFLRNNLDWNAKRKSKRDKATPRRKSEDKKQKTLIEFPIGE